MKFKYIKDDPMDEVPNNIPKMILSFLGCLGYLAGYLCLWCLIFGWRP